MEDRATLAPPLPHGDYVRTMMELGELDDPSSGLEDPPKPLPQVSPLRAPPQFSLDRDLLLDEAGDDPSGRRTATAPRRDAAATAPVRPPSYAPPSPRPPAIRLPVPRAPSVHPEDDADEIDVFGGLDPLEGLDLPDDESFAPKPPPVNQVRPGPAARPRAGVGAAGLRLGRPARRDTPTGWLGKGAPAPMSPFDEPRDPHGASPRRPRSSGERAGADLDRRPRARDAGALRSGEPLERARARRERAHQRPRPRGGAALRRGLPRGPRRQVPRPPRRPPGDPAPDHDAGGGLRPRAGPPGGLPPLVHRRLHVNRRGARRLVHARARGAPDHVQPASRARSRIVVPGRRPGRR